MQVHYTHSSNILFSDSLWLGVLHSLFCITRGFWSQLFQLSSFCHWLPMTRSCKASLSDGILVILATASVRKSSSRAKDQQWLIPQCHFSWFLGTILWVIRYEAHGSDLLSPMFWTCLAWPWGMEQHPVLLKVNCRCDVSLLACLSRFLSNDLFAINHSFFLQARDVSCFVAGWWCS